MKRLEKSFEAPWVRYLKQLQDYQVFQSGRFTLRHAEFVEQLRAIHKDSPPAGGMPVKNPSPTPSSPASRKAVRLCNI